MGPDGATARATMQDPEVRKNVPYIHKSSDALIFSTHERRPQVVDEIRAELHAYLGGIVRELGGIALMVNGPADHVHMLLRLPGDMAVADAMRIVKTNSSRWVHEKWRERTSFAWQAGYGAFSVSESQRGTVIKYIQEQEKHHRRVSFRDEFIALLNKHGVEYDDRYIWK